MPAKRQSAFFRATQDAQSVVPLDSETVKPRSDGKAKKEEKISFYLTHEQAGKLDDLAYEYKKRTGKRVNRNDIVRYLIDGCSIDSLGTMS